MNNYDRRSAVFQEQETEASETERSPARVTCSSFLVIYCPA